MNISVITLIKGSLFHIKGWIARLCLRMTTHEWKFPLPPTPGHVLIWADSIMIPSCREGTVYQNGLILKLMNFLKTCNVLNMRPTFTCILPVPCTADHYRRQHKFWMIMIFKFVPGVHVFTGKIEKSSCNPQPFSLPVIGSVIRVGQIWFHYHQLIPD